MTYLNCYELDELIDNDDTYAHEEDDDDSDIRERYYPETLP